MIVLAKKTLSIVGNFKVEVDKDKGLIIKHSDGTIQKVKVEEKKKGE